MDDILEGLFGDLYDGGPESGDRAIDVVICHINRRLAPTGIAIVSSRHGYRKLVDLIE